MPDPIRPTWLAGLRIIGPAEQYPSKRSDFPPGSWIVRHSINSRELAPLDRAGHPMRALDDSHTLIGPTIYLAR